MVLTFKANNPYNNFLLFLYGIGLKLVMFLHPSAPAVQISDGVLYKYFLSLLQPIGATAPIIYSVVSFILIYVQAIAFNHIVNTQRLFPKPTYLVGMAYFLITSLFPEWMILSAPLIVSSFLIWVWSKLCTLHNTQSPKTTLFNIGLAIGVATFFYYPSIVFVLLILVGLAIARPFKLPEWIIALVGLLTPFYFFAAWLFLSDNWTSYKIPETGVILPLFYTSKWGLTAVIMLILSTIIGFTFIQNNIRRQLVQTRKSWQLIYLYLFVACAVPFLNIAPSFNYWILTSVPLAIIISAAFYYPEKKWFPAFIHWAMVALVIAISYFFR